jgi:chorismate synthase
MLRFLTAGESHGPQLTAVLEGMPAGLPVDRAELNRQMARRQTGYGSGGRMKIERDEIQITAGVTAGQTTGGPIALNLTNLDYAKWAEREIAPMTIPRPGHADLTGAIKYGYRELRLSLERSSARETAMRVAVGALCQQLLAQFGVIIGSYVTSIGELEAEIPAELGYAERFAFAEENDLRCPVESAVEPWRQKIWEIMQAKDTLGGIFEVVALNAPPGLGSHVHADRRLEAQLMASVGSIQAIKGVEIGHGFANSRLPGSAVARRNFPGGRRPNPLPRDEQRGRF